MQLYDFCSVPGTGEDPVSPVSADGERVAMLSEYDMIGGTRSSERKKGKKDKEECASRPGEGSPGRYWMSIGGQKHF
ncbi:MAG: hypothetical protein Q3M24_12650 [Candidatus Electrothrix aestuarii]|uniref:Uncharacterized protein n=1 Tax=Candidatus Electrothrix aestuarii TaxID=3062594 RepID=A0AAU8LQJ3_9BACT|nr:hypothetical protein [Candidatus Electrothrix aestuarii]